MGFVVFAHVADPAAIDARSTPMPPNASAHSVIRGDGGAIQEHQFGEPLSHVALLPADCHAR